MRGTITRERTVWCSLCNDFLQLPHETKKAMVMEIERYGWRKDKKLGWKCPECFKDAKGAD